MNTLLLYYHYSQNVEKFMFPNIADSINGMLEVAKGTTMKSTFLTKKKIANVCRDSSLEEINRSI